MGYGKKITPAGVVPDPPGVRSAATLESVVSALTALIVDRDPFATRALVASLARASDIVVVGTAPDARSSLDRARALSPDVVVMDATTAGGFAVVRELAALTPSPAVLVLSREGEDLGLEALRAGAAGYLDKQVSVDVLPRLVRVLAAGEIVLSRGMTSRVVDRLRAVPETGFGLRPVRSVLSTREWEVLDLLSRGATTRAIAKELGLTVETVRSHVKRVLRKLGAHSRAEAVERGRTLMAGAQPAPSQHRRLA